MLKTKFKNGDKVRDEVSGLEGTITCVAVYMNGCIRYNVQPGLDEEGHYQDGEAIDEQQLILIKPKKAKKTERPGGDRPFLPKYKL
jgi:hypothetical protein